MKATSLLGNNPRLMTPLERLALYSENRQESQRTRYERELFAICGFLVEEAKVCTLDSASIAAAIRNAVPAGCAINGNELPEELINKGVRYVIESLSFALSEAHPTHDRATFLRACGVQS